MEIINQNVVKLHQLQRKLHISHYSIRNHLLSILKDAETIENVLAYLSNYKFKCLTYANLRNGIWYRNKFDNSCYYKSTDGHVNNWQFSLKRLNLHVAKDLINNVVIIVDSTRQGKRFPDSIIFTIPIWSAVINSIIFGTTNHNLNLPDFVPESNRVQIIDLLPIFLALIPSASLNFIKSQLSDMIKPIIPIFLCPAEDESIDWIGKYSEDFIDNIEDVDNLNFKPILLFSCSSTYTTNDQNDWYYIQGAGDDEEFWSNGLTSSLFWENKDIILSSSENDIENIIKDLVTRNREVEYLNRISNIIKVGNLNIFITTNLQDILSTSPNNDIEFDGIIIMTNISYDFDRFKSIPKLHLKTVSNKKEWRRDIHHLSDKDIPTSLAFYESLGAHPKILIMYDDLQQCCTIILAIIVRYHMKTICDIAVTSMNVKECVQSALTWIQSYITSANPNRRDMKELNIYFTRSLQKENDNK